MPDTNTSILNLLLMERDSHDNDWGDQTNANLELIARTLGTVSHAVTTGTTTLTRDNVIESIHRVTGVLVGNVTIEVPATEPKSYFWKNETTGAFTVTIKVTGQTGVVLPQGETRLLRCNGTDVVDCGLYNDKFATVVGGTVDAITITTVPAYAVYSTAMRFRFNAAGANTITNPTINVDGIGAKTIKRHNSAALVAGDISGSTHICDCFYNGTDVILLNPATIDHANTFTAAQTFSGPVVNSKTTLTDAATIAWSLATGGPDYEVTLGGNRTLDAFTGGTAGQQGILRVIQDATGTRTLALTNAVYDFWGPSIENIARGANEVTEYDYKVISAGSMFLKRRGATSIREGGRDFLDEKTAAASSTIDFVLTKWLALYDRFEIDFDNVYATNDNDDLWLRTSTDAGSSFGTSNYSWRFERSRQNTGNSASNSGDAAIVIISSDASCGLSDVSTETGAGTIVMYAPSVAGKCKFTWTCINFPSSSSLDFSTIDGAAIKNTSADVDAIRFLCSTGTIAGGTFRLFGVRK